MPADHKKSKYHVEIAPGIWIDTYDVARAYGITDPAHNHALKKVLVTGGRNEKGIVQDIDEAIWSLNNFKEVLGDKGEDTTCKHVWAKDEKTCLQCGIIKIIPIAKDVPRAVVGTMDDDQEEESNRYISPDGKTVVYGKKEAPYAILGELNYNKDTLQVMPSSRNLASLAPSVKTALSAFRDLKEIPVHRFSRTGQPCDHLWMTNVDSFGEKCCICGMTKR